MNIVVVTNENNKDGGGLAYSCQRFVKMLNRIGHHVLVISSSNIKENEISGGYNPHLGFELAMEKKLKTDHASVAPYDLIISFGGGFNGYYGALLARKTMNRFWVMYRGSDANLCKWSIEQTQYNKFSCDTAEKIICLSSEIISNLKLICKQYYKFNVIPNSAHRVSSRIKELSSSDTIVLGTGATNLNEKKGVSELLHTLAYLAKRIHNRRCILDLVGRIDEDVKAQYEDIASELDITNQVVFYGRKTREEFREIQAGWNFYIQASICEGMGNSVVDAMSMGIPVILSDTGFVAEYAKERFEQIIFPSLNPQIMAEKIACLILSKDLNKRYESFYSSFFDAVSPEKIENEWRYLLNSGNISKKSVRCHKDGVLSVSLHDVQGSYHDNITTPTRVFEKFVDDVHAAGYKLCSMKEYALSSDEDKQSLIVCTFDDGYDGLIHNALPIMKKHNFTATVYVCTDYLGQYNDWNYKDKTRRRHMDIAELKTLKEHGWEIGSHGVTHQSLLRLNDAEIHDQLSVSKEILRNHFGDITTYAYPYGDFSPFIESQVKKYYDSAVLLTQGGVYLPVDQHRIHRYYISEIYQILKGAL